MSKIKEKTKDLYTNHETGDDPEWWIKLCDKIEYSFIGLLPVWIWGGYGSSWCGIKYIPKEIKYFFQRGFRGFSDDSLWSLDYYLGNQIVKSLQAFKDMPRMGYPGYYNQELMTSDGGQTSKKSEREAVKAWNKDLQDMIDGFKFLCNEAEDYYQVCLTKYPKSNKRDSQMRRKMYDQRYALAKEQATKFITHFNSLWD